MRASNEHGVNPTPRNALSVRHVFDPHLTRTVTRPERPKGAKDEVKQARRAADWKLGPGGPPKLLVLNNSSTNPNIKQESKYKTNSE